MGGQNAIKGYLFQSMIALLNSFDKAWDFICVEPNTELDKIDIIWSNDVAVEVSQVKSSINNFSKNDILKWLNYLLQDNPNAEKYSLCLIGSSNSMTKQFFNSIDSKTIEDFPSDYKSLESIKDKISVIFEPNNIATMQSALIAGIDKFFFSHDILADHPIKSLIADGMVNQIIRLSTSGTKMSRGDFEKQLLDWVRFNYPNQIKSKNKPSFAMSFYRERKMDFSDTITKTSLSAIEDLEIYRKKMVSLITKFNTLSKYNFEVKSFEEPTRFELFFGISSFASDELNGYTDRQVIVDNLEIERVSKLCSQILGFEPSREFFNFGELKESRTKNITFIFSSKRTWQGTEEEKEKKKLYDIFYSELRELDDLKAFWDKVIKLSVLPLVLSNIGTQFEEDIKVHLFFPKSVKVYSYKNFPSPKTQQILSDITRDDSFLFDIVRHKNSRQVEAYSHQYLYPQFFSIPSLSGDSRIEDLRKLRRILDYYFEYEFFDEEQHKVFEYNFKSLNSNTKVAFPAFLFISSNIDFTIDYKITCKNNIDTIDGKLYYRTVSK